MERFACFTLTDSCEGRIIQKINVGKNYFDAGLSISGNIEHSTFNVQAPEKLQTLSSKYQIQRGDIRPSAGNSVKRAEAVLGAPIMVRGVQCANGIRLIMAMLSRDMATHDNQAGWRRYSSSHAGPGP